MKMLKQKQMINDELESLKKEYQSLYKIIFVGTDTQGISLIKVKGNSWREICDELLEKNKISHDDLDSYLFNVDEFGNFVVDCNNELVCNELSEDDYKELVTEHSNAYYVTWFEEQENEKI